MSTKQDLVYGTKWSAASQFSRQSMQLVVSIILARLLSPSDFGLFSMTLVVTGFVALFNDLGTSAALIQKKEINEALLCSIFWINIAFGAMTTIAIFLLAPFAATFYHEPRVTVVLRVLCWLFVISGLSILQKALLERTLQFKKLAKVEIIGTTFGSCIGIGLAIMKAGVWSLVFQGITVACVTTVLFWRCSNWRPKIIFRWGELRTITNFSLNLLGHSVVNYFARNIDYLLIGRFLGAQNLGYYTLAYRIMLYPLENIAWVIRRVTFPFFSRLQDDDAKFRQIYLSIVRTIALFSFPMMLGLVVASEPFVLTVFGLKWTQVAVLLKILAPVGLVQSLATLNGSIYAAKGRTDLQFRVGIVFTILFSACFAIGLRWGIIGVAAAYGITTALLTFPSFAIPFRLINLRLRQFGAAILRPLLASLFMQLVVMVLKVVLRKEMSSAVILFILVFIGIIAYCVTSWLMNREQVRTFVHLLANK
jgi:O-antigen/teichoic acid export membrane protein